MKELDYTKEEVDSDKVKPYIREKDFPNSHPCSGKGLLGACIRPAYRESNGWWCETCWTFDVLDRTKLPMYRENPICNIGLCFTEAVKQRKDGKWVCKAHR